MKKIVVALMALLFSTLSSQGGEISFASAEDVSFPSSRQLLVSDLPRAERKSLLANLPGLTERSTVRKAQLVAEAMEADFERRIQSGFQDVAQNTVQLLTDEQTSKAVTEALQDVSVTITAQELNRVQRQVQVQTGVQLPVDQLVPFLEVLDTEPTQKQVKAALNNVAKAVEDVARQVKSHVTVDSVLNLVSVLPDEVTTEMGLNAEELKELQELRMQLKNAPTDINMRVSQSVIFASINNVDDLLLQQATTLRLSWNGDKLKLGLGGVGTSQSYGGRFVFTFTPLIEAGIAEYNVAADLLKYDGSLYEKNYYNEKHITGYARVGAMLGAGWEKVSSQSTLSFGAQVGVKDAFEQIGPNSGTPMDHLFGRVQLKVTF